MTKWIKLAGLVEYDAAIKLMEQKLSAIISNAEKDCIYLLEHEEVYTAGSSYKDDELLAGDNIPVIYTGRGGKFTYHGPGQRVIYPIINLNNPNRKKDIKLYVRNLESWIINTLARLNVKAYTIPGKVGIWVKHRNTHAKIAAIGIRVRKWVTYHGIAINIETNLNRYLGIIPCGIKDFPVTSLKELGIKTTMENFDSLLKEEFVKIFK